MREAEIIELAIRRVGMRLEQSRRMDLAEIGKHLKEIADEIADLCRIHKEQKK
jgi:hypothetical protein